MESVLRNWERKLLFVLAVLVFGWLFAVPHFETAHAVNPTTMNFQGKVVNADGTNVANGSYNFVFRMYTVSSAGTAIWTETQNLTVTNGVFQADLGAVCTFFAANPCNNNTPIDFNSNPNIYLGVTFNADPAGEMSPRIKLQSVPYAFNADRVGGLTASQLAQLDPSSQQSGNINTSGSGTFDGGLAVTDSLSINTLGQISLGSSSNAGSIVLRDGAGGSNSVTVTTPTLSSSYSISLPSVGPATNQCLKSDAATASQLIFGDCAAIGQKLTQTFNTYRINQAANSTTSMSFLVPTTNTAFSIALAGTTEFKAASSGSFRACSLMSSAAVTGGSVSVRLSKNGVSASTNDYCTLNTTDTRTNSQEIPTGVETFAAGDTIGLNLVSSGLAPTTLEFWATFTIEYGAGGVGPTSMQDAYTNGAGITTVNGSDLAFNLADTAIDSNFIVNIASGSAGRFAVQNNGVDSLTLDNSGSLTITGSINGSTITGGSLSASAVNGLSVSGAAITGSGALDVASGGTAQNLTLNASTSGLVQIGSTSTGDIELGGGVGSSGCTVVNSTGTFSCSSTLNGATISGGTLSGTDVNGLSINGGTINNAVFSGTLTGTGSPAMSGFGTINGATLSGGALSGGTISGGTLTSSAVNGLNVSGTAISGTGALSLNASGANAISIGSISTGNILLGGGLGSTGCTLTNATGDLDCNGTINGATLSGGALSGGTISGGTLTSSAVNGLNVSGTAISGTGALSITAGGVAQNLILNGTTTGLIQIGGVSTGNIEIGGGSASSGCTITNSTGDFACSGNTIVSNQGVEFTESDTNPVCAAGDYSIYADLSETELKKCVNGVVSNIYMDEIRSFVDTTADPVVDANTTSYWDNAAENNNTRPNITLTGVDKEIFGIVTMEVQSTGTGDIEVTARLEASTSASTACNSGTAVGSQIGVFGTNTNVRKVSSANFLYTPANTTRQYFNVCSDADTVGTTGNITRLRVTLWEVDNSNADLAEVYPTTDKTLKAGDLVSLDNSIENGVKRSTGAYDKQIMGVVSTSPALVIGGKGSQGVNGVPVALSGRVPVKVSTENGEIKPGDQLTASSLPGVAMKATKAGSVLGMAMEGYSGTGTGSVMTFVKTGNSTGGGLAKVLKELKALNSGSSEGDLALRYLLDNKQSLNGETGLSEVLTDRLVAGLEVVTPKVITSELDVSDIALFKKDVHINGTLYADKIKANQIEGLEIVAKEIISSMEERKSAGDMSTDTISLTPTTATLDISASSIVVNNGSLQLNDVGGNPVAVFDHYGNVNIKGKLDVASLTSRGGLVVGGDISVAGHSVFQKLATFIGKVVFRSDIEVEGHIAVGEDVAGYALLRKGEDKVHVKFNKPYEAAPIVNASVVNGKYVTFTIKEVTKEGFDINLQTKAEEDVVLSWTALVSKNPFTAQNSIISASQ